MDEQDSLSPAERRLIRKAVRAAFAKGRDVGERAGYARGREEAKTLLSFAARLNGSTHTVLKALDDAPDDVPDRDDPHELIAAAMVEAAHDAMEAGEDPRHAVESLRALLDDPAALSAVLAGSASDEAVAKACGWFVLKAWDSSKHPRSSNGHFISKDRMEDAKHDPKLAAKLRAEVKPEDAEKLEKVLSGDEEGPGRTKRGQARHEAGQRREAKQTTREAAEKVIKKLTREGDLKGTVSADDLHALADHLQSGHMTVADLRRVRDAMRGATIKAGFGGSKDKAGMVAALVAHAKGEGFERRLQEQGITGEQADAMRTAAGMKPKAAPAEVPAIPVREAPIPTTGQLGAWGRAVDAARERAAPPTAEPTPDRLTGKLDNIDQAEGGGTANPDLPDQSRPALTPEQRQAVKDYSNIHYKEINAEKRGLPPTRILTDADRAKMAKAAKGLGEAFAAAKPFDKPVKVYRNFDLESMPAGARDKFMAALKDAHSMGGEIRLPGYTSTSTDPAYAEDDGFSGASVKMTIAARKGLDMEPHTMLSGERELLLDHDSGFKVKSIREENGVYHVEMEQTEPTTRERAAGVADGQAERGQAAPDAGDARGTVGGDVGAGGGVPDLAAKVSTPAPQAAPEQPATAPTTPASTSVGTAVARGRRRGGADDARPTADEVAAAMQPGPRAVPAPEFAPDMAMLDQQPDAVEPGTRTGAAVAVREKRQAKRSGTPPKK